MLLVAPLQLRDHDVAGAPDLLLRHRARGTSYLGLLIGHVVVCMPYVFLTVAAVLYNFDRSLERRRAASGRGASRRFGGSRFRSSRVVSSRRRLLVHHLFDQFPISLLLSGVGTTTLPIQVFDYLRFSFDPTAAAVGTVNILITLGVVHHDERLVGLESLYVGGRQ